MTCAMPLPPTGCLHWPATAGAAPPRRLQPRDRRGPGEAGHHRRPALSHRAGRRTPAPPRPGRQPHLNYLDGPDSADCADTGQADWRTWVDETVVSWAACLLAEPALASRAHQALAATDHTGLAGDPRRLTLPAQRDTDAAPLLRHPDLLEPVAALHRHQLLALLAPEASPLP
ncbi:hypothetical protein [Kitasatospora sp. NPDC051914]|uniref:hypothetical protein n=1 Tax=Kitasatospora sp. NPDC051914 TaxID=3154945 RepID=UPI00343E160D